MTRYAAAVSAFTETPGAANPSDPCRLLDVTSGAMSRRFQAGLGWGAAMPVVLVVEDEPVIRMDAAETLEDEGFVVIEAATARAALALLEKRTGDVDALFTDVDMPGDMNGLEPAGIVHSRWPHIAIVVTSGVVRVSGSLPGGGIFLAKPYPRSTPVRVIRDLIDRAVGS